MTVNYGRGEAYLAAMLIPQSRSQCQLIPTNITVILAEHSI